MPIIVGHVVASLASRWGGPVAVLAGLVPLLSSRTNVRILAPVGVRSGTLDVRPDGGEIWPTATNVGSRIWTGYGPRVAAEAARFVAGCDVIHIHELWHYPHFAAARAARNKRVPMIISPHGALEPWVLRYKGARKKLYSALFQRRELQEAAFIQALTPGEADAVARFGVPRERIRVIPNGLPLATVSRLQDGYQGGADPVTGRKGYGLFLGRVHRQKGLDILVRALPQLIPRHPDIHIVIAGSDEGGYRSHVEALAQSLGVRDRLSFTGLVKGDEKWKLLMSARFFVLPSYSEGFSMALLEALAAGVPVVATKVCEVGTLERNEAAVLVDLAPEALASGIDRVLSDPQLARHLRENGRRLVLEQYTWERVAKEVLGLYEEALETRKARRRR